MGGGDLNMKKSFHPLTMANLERVFNAELKRDTELKKVEQLRREIAEERQREELHKHAVDTGVIKGKAARLDWMYAGPGTASAGAEREEYLLGKKIDKDVDPLQQDTTEKTDATAVASSIFTDATMSGANSQRDMAAKIREDPLFAIKKQEEQARKNLLNNPVRMKQLQQMLRQQTGDGSDSSSSDDDSDRSPSPAAPRSGRAPPQQRSRHRQRSPSPRRRRDGRERSRSPRERRQRHDRSRSPQRGARASRHGYDDSKDRSTHHRHRRSEQSPERQSHRRQAETKPKRADPEEAERRRKEMMAAAKAHHKERDTRVRKRQHAADREEAELRGRTKKHDEDFFFQVNSMAGSKIK
ncbi:pre-mRNA-splicing factor CWC25 homolog isoform X2 [Sycon ciliatum]|uniref:pre-mRNA-splicing factor CWC25 homolog isoform X2 n=1 Tax=Sycon ciliatum TaxID=27933 RepID=UPI0031F67972